MRPVSKTLSAAAASATSIAAAQAPASGVAMTLAASPSFTYNQKLTLISAANLSAINFVIVGTDARGFPLSETIAGPNIATVTTTNYFKSVTSITPSGTSASTLTVGNALAATSDWVIPDFLQAPFSIGIGCVVSGTITYGLQHTFDDPFDSSVTPTWFDNLIVQWLSANQDTNYSAPIRAMRLIQSAGTGSVTAKFIQGIQP